MNKKILIGSIIAITILIGVSFTSVVGYRSVSSEVKASPLFNIRSSRAIDEESEYLRCEYIGKHKRVLTFPSNLNSNEFRLKEVINIVNKMSPKAYNRFIMLIICHVEDRNKPYIINSKDVFLTLNKLRDTKEMEGNYDIIRFDDTPFIPTPDPFHCTIDVWGPGCFIKFLIDIIWVIRVIIHLYLDTAFCTINPNCCYSI